jgi:prepilin-type N-terminal cleavage/methylation domain-containing protein
MKSTPPTNQPPGPRRLAAFTLVELMVAVAISTVLLAMSGTFIILAARSSSGIVQQAMLNERAGRTTEFIFQRIRFATSMTQDVTGNVLTLGYDTNYLVDSDGDKKAYNDRDYYEVFQFLNGATSDSSSLVYKPNANVAKTNVLLKSGVRKLPNKNVFTVTNGATVIVRFGLVDSYATDGYQEVDVKATFVARNRPPASQVVSILPDN